MNEKILKLLEHPLSKRASTEQKILTSVVELSFKKGFDQFTFDELSLHSETSRQLIYRYFPSREALLVGAFALVRDQFQKDAVGVLKPSRSNRSLLRRYSEFVLDWCQAHPSLSSLLLLGLRQAHTYEPLRTLNFEFVRTGTERIEALLSQEAPTLNPRQVQRVAKNIQNFIMGTALCLHSEPVTLPSLKKQLWEGIESWLS